MSMPPVWGFIFDDRNEEKLAKRGIYPEQAQQVLSNRHRVEPNSGKRQHRATHRVIGFDNGGRCLTLPIEPTYEEGIWYPVTGWLATLAERQKVE